MRFRLSTLFLFVAIAAMSLGWYVDHTRRWEIVGTWVYPTPDIAMLGYSTTLTIRADGTFTKIQSHRLHSVTYQGEYTWNEGGSVAFRVTSKSETAFLSEPQAKIEEGINDAYVFRCAVDKAGFLLIKEADPHIPDSVIEELQGCERSGIRWESYVGNRKIANVRTQNAATGSVIDHSCDYSASSNNSPMLFHLFAVLPWPVRRT